MTFGVVTYIVFSKLYQRKKVGAQKEIEKRSTTVELVLILGGVWFLSYAYQRSRQAQRDYVDTKIQELHDTIMEEVRAIVNGEVTNEEATNEEVTK